MDTLADAVVLAVRKAGQHAREHCCTHHCGNKDYAEGQPPPGWEAQLKRLAGNYGYTFHRDWLPVELNGEDCNGVTIGTPQNFDQVLDLQRRGIAARSVHYHPAAPAQEFSVAVHEVAHAILGHPDRPSVSDAFDDEMPVRLAAVAVCEAAGLRNTSMNTCQLVQRMHGAGQNITEHHAREGLKAARVIGQALASKTYARAA